MVGTPRCGVRERAAIHAVSTCADGAARRPYHRIPASGGLISDVPPGQFESFPAIILETRSLLVGLTYEALLRNVSHL